MKIFKGRAVEIESISHGADPVDSTIMSAYFTDTGENLNDGQLDELQNSTDLYDEWFEAQIDKADRARDEARDAE